MRIIINDELFLSDGYIELTKPESDKLFRLIGFFAKNDSEELPMKLIKENFDITDEFIKKTYFCLEFGKIVKVKKHFTWFKGNKKHVAKYRSNPKSEVVTEVIVETVLNDTVEPIKEPIDKVDYDKLKEIYNTSFKEFKTKKILEMNDGRKKMFKKCFVSAKKTYKDRLKDFDIYEFYQAYFDLIVSDTRYNLTKGWMNSQAGSWFQPELTYFTQEKIFVKIYEDYITSKEINI